MSTDDHPSTGLPADATIAVAGGKGGCGKTTATLGLAIALADRGHHPLVVDADVDVPDLHIRAGVDREPGLPAVAGGAHPARVSQASERFPGVSVLAAGTTRGSVEASLADVAALPRPVVLDCPAGAGPDAVAPLRVADATVVVSSATRASRTDAAKTARMARSVGATPRCWFERSVEGGRPGDVPVVLYSIHRHPIPDGGRRPLASEPVRRAFRRVGRALVESTPAGPRPSEGRQGSRNAVGYGRKL